MKERTLQELQEYTPIGKPILGQTKGTAPEDRVFGTNK